jgi:hypothetical protein
MNIGSPNLLDDVYNPIIIENLDRLSVLLTEKISSVEVQAPAPSPKPRHKHASLSYTYKGVRRNSTRPSPRPVSIFKKVEVVINM